MLEKLIIRDGRIKFALFLLLGCGALVWFGLGDAGTALLEPAFVGTCLLMGLTFGIDVMCLMISQARTVKTSSDMFMLAYRTAIGHIGFPIAGAVVCLALAAWIGALAQLIGIAGFVLIVFVYWKEGAEALQSDEKPHSETVSYADIAQWGLVIAVSLDSLLYGPVFSAEGSDRPAVQVPAAFVAAGMIVGILGATAGLLSAAVFRRANHRSAAVAARMQYWGLFAELSVIGYFGLVALVRSGLGLDPGWLVLALASAGATTLFFFCLGQRLWKKQLAGAEESFSVAHGD